MRGKLNYGYVVGDCCHRLISLIGKLVAARQCRGRRRCSYKNRKTSLTIGLCNMNPIMDSITLSFS